MILTSGTSTWRSDSRVARPGWRCSPAGGQFLHADLDFAAGRQPRNVDPNRLAIPRSFAASEWACLFARLFERLGLPVVRTIDLTDTQALFRIDTCALPYRIDPDMLCARPSPAPSTSTSPCTGKLPT